MNKFLSGIVILGAVLSAASCDPVKNSYETTTYRLATVSVVENSVMLVVDRTEYENEYKIKPDNLRTVSDLEAMHLQKGDRGIAGIFYRVDDQTSELSLQSFNRIELEKFNSGSYGQDTLGTYFHFNTMQISYDAKYGPVWNNGHIVNTVVTYYPNPRTPGDSIFFNTYPKEVRNDTLSLLIKADIPDCNYKYDGQGRLLQYDLSGIRTLASSASQTINNALDSLKQNGKDSIYVEFATCRKLEIMNDSTLRTADGDTRCCKVPLDF